MESVIFLTILILLLPKNRRRVLTGQVSPHVLVTIQIFSTIFTLCTIPRPEYLSLVEIPFPPLTVLTLVSTAQPELFHPQVTVLPPLLPTTQHLSDINKEKDSLAIKLLGTQVGVIFDAFTFTYLFLGPAVLFSSPIYGAYNYKYKLDRGYNMNYYNYQRF